MRLYFIRAREFLKSGINEPDAKIFFSYGTDPKRCDKSSPIAIIIESNSKRLVVNNKCGISTFFALKDCCNKRHIVIDDIIKKT